MLYIALVVLCKMDISPLVSAEWLNTNRHGEKILVFDCSWLPGWGGGTNYKQCHIPEAIFFDMDKVLRNTPLIPFDLAEPHVFEGYARNLGIDDDTHVVLYDKTVYPVPIPAARLWWMFQLYGHAKVSVLDGGLEIWMKKGLPTSSLPVSNMKRGKLAVKYNGSLIVSVKEVRQCFSSSSAQIVDTRLAPNFLGEEMEPCSNLAMVMAAAKIDITNVVFKGGHMINSKNLPYVLLVDKEREPCLKPHDKLIALFNEVGIHPSRPVIATCLSGFTACTYALAAASTGRKDIKVYLGSWAEFGQVCKDEECICDVKSTI